MAVVFLTSLLLPAQTLTTIYSFGAPPDGGGPNTPVRDHEGNLYLSTFSGGTYDFGTVVKIDPLGNETVLHSFSGGSDGMTPISALRIDANGNLYGTTYWGGSTACFDGNGCGVVYELSPTKNGWTETILYAFQGGSDGAYPEYGALVSDKVGNLYGTALYGGKRNWPNGGGVVYKLSHTASGWKQSVIYAFGANSASDGANPYSGVTLDPRRDSLFGTTYYGGTENLGTVYRISRNGSETILHNFKGGSGDGQDPMAGVVVDQEGNVYGTTPFGGDQSCVDSYPLACGVAYKLDPSGAETILHAFAGYPSDGAYPGALTYDEAGNLYGFSNIGGSSKNCLDSNSEIVGCGVIFGIAATGSERILYDFQSQFNSNGPVELVLGSRALYGATQLNYGTVFKFAK